MRSESRYVKKNSKVILYVSLLGIVLLLLVNVAMQMYIISLEEQVNEIRKDLTLLETEIKSLELTAADLSKGSRIKEYAQERLGLEMPVGAPQPLY